MRARGFAQSEEAHCDYCKQRKGRNAMIVHHLKFDHVEGLRHHLMSIFPDDTAWVKSIVDWYNFVHRYYGRAAWDKYQPIWLTYLEAHKVTVNNRSQAIMDYRKSHPRQEGWEHHV